jgi:hypothetical protein
LIERSDVHAVHRRQIVVEQDAMASKLVDPALETLGNKTAVSHVG